MAFHDRGVVRIRNHRVLGRQLVGVADHAEQALVLRHTVDVTDDMLASSGGEA